MDFNKTGKETSGKKLGKNEARLQLDKLELCFRVENKDLNYLRSDICGKSVGKYILKASIDMYYDYCFDIYDFDDTGYEHLPVGKLLFGFKMDKADFAYVHLQVANRILYQPNRLREIVYMPYQIGESVVFNNFTRIDIAVDTCKNVESKIKKLIRDANITTIHNGKKVKERKNLLKGVQFVFSTSCEKLLYPSLRFSQKKAIKKKDEEEQKQNNTGKGIVVQAYNKKAEIAERPYKQYILEYYGNPKSLHRLEVRLPYEAIRRFLKSHGMEFDINMIFDKNILLEMFLNSLKSVIRFTDNSRKPIPWNEILNIVL